MQAMVAKAKAAWGGVHILINNAGILRDKSFAKMDMADFRAVVDVHLIGSANCTHAVWGPMREQGYGRILMTASSTGLYGNFGQANYGAAKLGVAGFARTLALEGARDNISVNTIAPTAATRMTEDLFPPELLARFRPELVVPAALFLVSEDAPDGRHPRRRRRRRPGRPCHPDQRRGARRADAGSGGREFRGDHRPRGRDRPAIGRRAGDDDHAAAAGAVTPSRIGISNSLPMR